MTRFPGGSARWLGLAMAAILLPATAILAATPTPCPIQSPTLVAGGGSHTRSTEVLAKPLGARPNVLLILADDLGYGDLGCYGSDYILSPELDQLAAEGVKLTNFSCNSAGCTPSRISILTGTMGTYHGFQSVNTNQTRRGIPSQVTTLAEVLRNGGYNTGHVGKWHIGENLGEDSEEFLPPGVGFDWSARLHIPTQQTHWHPQMELNEETTLVHKGEHSTRVITDYALEFLDEQASEDDPWFLNLWYYAPHLPMEVPVEYLGLYPKSEPAALWTKFAAMVSQMDEGIGEIMDKLDDLGMTEDTLVIFLSDNGGSLSPGLHPNGMGGLTGGKGDFTDGGIRVPFIARWPGVIPANSVSPDKIYASDILPTAQELVGSLKVLPHIEGNSMLDTLRGDDGGARTENLYWAGKAGYSPPFPQHGIFEIFSVRQDHRSIGGKDFKLIFTDQSKTQLFDMVEDPTESTNLADVYPGKTQKLWNAFWKTRRSESELSFTPAMHGEVIDLDGPLMFFNGLVDAKADAWFDFHNGHFTFSCELRIQKTGAEQVITRKEGSWELVLTDTDLIELTLWPENGKPVVLSSSTPVTSGQNVSVAWTIVRWATPIKDNDVRLWVDDALADIAEIPEVAANRNDLRFGNDDVPPLGTRPFTGVMNAIEFHNVALTKEEIAGSFPAIPPTAD